MENKNLGIFAIAVLGSVSLSMVSDTYGDLPYDGIGYDFLANMSWIDDLSMPKDTAGNYYSTDSTPGAEQAVFTSAGTIAYR